MNLRFFLKGLLRIILFPIELICWFGDDRSEHEKLIGKVDYEKLKPTSRKVWSDKMSSANAMSNVRSLR